MSTVTPFSTLPLSGDPYFSRTSNNMDSVDIKNYFLVGFKPGFPLQASELNEVQEQFFVQQTLTAMCINDWYGKGTAGPFWSGATPLTSSLLSVTAGAGTNTPTITLSAGWLFVRGSNTNGLGIWIYNDTARTYTTNITTTASRGVWIKSEVIDYTMDTDLSDNAGGGSRTGFGFINSGADRIKLTVTGSGTSAPDTSSVFYPIIETSASDGTSVKTINGYAIYTKI